MNPILVLVFSQLLFTSSDILARSQMQKGGFAISTFLTGWFLVYVVLRTFATFGQLYIFTTVPAGKTMAMFGAVSIILVNVLSFLFLREVLSPAGYLGVTISIIAFLVLAMAK